MTTAAEHRAHRARVVSLLGSAQRDGLPVHVATAHSTWVHAGYLVRTVEDADGCVDLVDTQNGERFTPPLDEVVLVATVDGRCVSRAARSVASAGRRRDVSTALSGVAALLAEPDLGPAERTRLEELVGQLACLTA